MTERWRFAVPFLGALSACSVNAAELSPSELAINQCDDDSTCYRGHCVERTCRALDGELTSLLVGVTPGTVSGIASVTYYREYPQLPADGGSLDIELSPAVSVVGSASIDTVKDCSPLFALGNGMSTTASPDGSLIPVDVTFTPSQRVLGIPAETYHAEIQGLFNFRASVAPGEYDVYIRAPYETLKNPAEETVCEIPPRLYLNQTVDRNLTYNLAPASKLRVTIEWPLPVPVDPATVAGQMLAGWTVDLVEPVSGRLLSARAELAEPTVQGNASWTYDTTLRYSPVLVPGKDAPQPTGVGRELVRLTPPDGVTAPIILAEVAGARLFDQPDAPAGVVLNARLAEPVEVEFQTAVHGVPTRVSAGVAFTATELDGALGVSMAFSRIVQVDKEDDGKAKVSLLPGRYRVVAWPKNACSGDYCLGTTLGEWIVPAAPAFQGGKVIEFDIASRLEGYASVATGGPAVGASVRAIASAFIRDTGVLDSGDGRVEALPRASVGVVDSNGDFSFEADTGTFDFRVEPDPTTGFGWLVQPRVVFPVADDTLSALSVPLPIVYQGSLTLENSPAPLPISGALIRAYVYVTDDGQFSPTRVDGAVAVQVAETHADEDGNYTLLIPRVLGSER